MASYEHEDLILWSALGVTATIRFLLSFLRI